MSIKTSLLTIISVVAVAAAAFPSFDAEKLDADSAGSLAAAGDFPSFNQNATASFPLSNAETDATTAAAFFALAVSFANQTATRPTSRPQAQPFRAKQTPFPSSNC